MLDKDGQEIPANKPRSMPAGLQRPPTLAEQVRRLVMDPVLQEDLRGAGVETFEESEDFDVDDEVDPSSPFEEFFDPDLGRGVTLHELERNKAIYKDRYLKAQKEMLAEEDRQAKIKASQMHRVGEWIKHRFKNQGVKGETPPSDASKNT